MKILRKASAAWSGTIKEGKGSISTQSGALTAFPYGYASRFEGRHGTNPEELLGAAHAGCFTMALSLILGQANLTPQLLETSAEVTLEQIDGKYTISSVHLVLKAKVPGATAAQFNELAGKAKADCPVSRVLNARVTLDATLVS